MYNSFAKQKKYVVSHENISPAQADFVIGVKTATVKGSPLVFVRLTTRNGSERDLLLPPEMAMTLSDGLLTSVEINARKGIH